MCNPQHEKPPYSRMVVFSICNAQRFRHNDNYRLCSALSIVIKIGLAFNGMTMGMNQQGGLGDG